jgi:hypothetical protein
VPLSVLIRPFVFARCTVINSILSIIKGSILAHLMVRDISLGSRRNARLSLALKNFARRLKRPTSIFPSSSKKLKSFSTAVESTRCLRCCSNVRSCTDGKSTIGTVMMVLSPKISISPGALTQREH